MLFVLLAVVIVLGVLGNGIFASATRNKNAVGTKATITPVTALSQQIISKPKDEAKVKDLLQQAKDSVATVDNSSLKYTEQLADLDKVVNNGFLVRYPNNTWVKDAAKSMQDKKRTIKVTFTDQYLYKMPTTTVGTEVIADVHVYNVAPNDINKYETYQVVKPVGVKLTVVRRDPTTQPKNQVYSEKETNPKVVVANGDQLKFSTNTQNTGSIKFANVNDTVFKTSFNLNYVAANTGSNRKLRK